MFVRTKFIKYSIIFNVHHAIGLLSSCSYTKLFVKYHYLQGLATQARRSVSRGDYQAMLSVLAMLRHVTNIQPEYDRLLTNCQTSIRAKFAAIIHMLQETVSGMDDIAQAYSIIVWQFITMLTLLSFLISSNSYTSFALHNISILYDFEIHK